MLGEKHDLVHELPEFKDRIQTLKTANNRFAKLFDDYDGLDHLIRRCETGVEVHSEEYVDGLKKRRLALKDELYHMLQNAA
jgi:uncharacterized protein